MSMGRGSAPPFRRQRNLQNCAVVKFPNLAHIPLPRLPNRWSRLAPAPGLGAGEAHRVEQRPAPPLAQCLPRRVRVRFHFKPTYSSWLNQVELWFAKIQRDLFAFNVPIRKREPQIPTDCANNDLGFDVQPFEQCWPRFDHGAYCSLADSFTEYLQHSPNTSWSRSSLTPNDLGIAHSVMPQADRRP
jgi:hypothetical protein